MGAISFQAMGSGIRVEVTDEGPAPARALRLAFSTFAEHERALDLAPACGGLAELNGAPGAPVRVSPLLFHAVRTALAAAAATGGWYDPLRRLDAAPAGRPLSLRARAGGTALLERPAETPSPRRVLLDQVRMTVELPAGTMLDLNGIAAGIAADAAARYLMGFPGYRIHAGGDLRAGGMGTGAGPWQVAIPDPRQTGVLLAALHVCDGAVATAARGRMSGGSLDVLSATVVTGTLAGAQAFARAVVRAGAAEGFRLLESHGLAGLLALRSGQVLVTERMGRRLEG